MRRKTMRGNAAPYSDARALWPPDKHLAHSVSRRIVQCRTERVRVGPIFGLSLLAELADNPRAEDPGSCPSRLSLRHGGIDGRNTGVILPTVFAIYPDAPGAMMSNDVKIGCH
jgi:hypothetical protein